MEGNNISKAALGRLPLYFSYLKELSKADSDFISASTIANALSLGEVQVRKDLAFVSTAGKPKVGYNVRELTDDLEAFLKNANSFASVVVSDGNLGRGLLEYAGFKEYGVKISADFDCTDDGFAEAFRAFVKENDVRIGIIAVSVASAQTVCDIMTESGISAIWNLAPCRLKLPEGIHLRQENLALSLAYLHMVMR